MANSIYISIYDTIWVVYLKLSYLSYNRRKLQAVFYFHICVPEDVKIKCGKLTDLHVTRDSISIEIPKNLNPYFYFTYNLH